MPTEIPLPSELTIDLYEGYQSMAEAALAVAAAIRGDGDDYAVFVPKYGETETDKLSSDAREAAIKSITRLYIADGEEFVTAGLLCASPKTVEQIRAFNKAKATFKEAVLAIRDYRKAKQVHAERVMSLLNDSFKREGYRSPELKRAMKNARISALDLQRCYAEIFITEPKLDVFSWTWATKHNRLKKVAVPKAEEMLREMLEHEPEKLARNLKKLAQCSPGEMLVYKEKLPNQLRANYGYWKDDKVVRKAIHVSGIVIAQQKKLPRYKWRDDPAITGQHTEQVERVSGIEAEMYITPLKLFRYVQ